MKNAVAAASGPTLPRAATVGRWSLLAWLSSGLALEALHLWKAPFFLEDPLRREFVKRGATIECLNFRIEDTPEGKFIETVIAAQGELEREQNRRQVVQKMKARVESGFWVFRAPVGYRYVSAPSGGGKVLVPDEVLGPIVQAALEGYATGHFASQAEVQRFLERNPHFPKDKKDGTLRPMTLLPSSPSASTLHDLARTTNLSTACVPNRFPVQNQEWAFPL